MKTLNINNTRIYCEHSTHNAILLAVAHLKPPNEHNLRNKELQMNKKKKLTPKCIMNAPVNLSRESVNVRELDA